VEADVVDINLELNLHLRTKRITLEKVIELLNKHIEGNTEITLQSMINFLSNPIFNIKKEDDVLILARYIIEDNYEERVPYDLDCTKSAYVVKSIIKHCIGQYKVYTDKEELELRHCIIDFFSEHKSRIRDSFSYLTSQIGDTCDIQTIKDQFTMMELRIDPEWMNFIILG